MPRLTLHLVPEAVWDAHDPGTPYTPAAYPDDGFVHCTDGDPANASKAEGYLTRAGLWDRIRYHVGDAVTSFEGVDGEFDVVYCDIDKHGYADAWRAARDRVRVGGLYLCDNVLWSGKVVTDLPDDDRPTWTAAVREHNELIAADALARASHKLAEAMYAKAAPGAGAAGGPSGDGGGNGEAAAGKGKDDVVEAEFEEVKE